MSQTMTVDARTLPGPESQPTGVGACVHEAVWVVDVASRRVIRRSCDVCVVTRRAVFDTNGLAGHAPRRRVPNARN